MIALWGTLLALLFVATVLTLVLRYRVNTDRQCHWTPCDHDEEEAFYDNPDTFDEDNTTACQDYTNAAPDMFKCVDNDIDFDDAFGL